MMKSNVVEKIPEALESLKKNNFFKDFGKYTEFVAYKKGIFKKEFSSYGQTGFRKLLQGEMDMSPKEVVLLNDSLAFCVKDKNNHSKIVTSEGYDGLEYTVSSNPTRLEESLEYIINLLCKGENSSLDDLNEEYAMDIDLLIHFIKVEKVLKRIVTDKFRTSILSDKELNFNTESIEKIFNFRSLSVDYDYLGKLESNEVSKIIASKYTVTKLRLGIFKYSGYVDKKDIMYKSFDDKNKAELYAYYTRTVRNFVTFCIRVIKQCYKNSGVYTIRKIADVEKTIGCKLNLGVGELEETITSTKLSSCINTICNDIYSRDKQFNKASMLGLVYLLSELVSKESVDISTIRRGLF